MPFGALEGETANLSGELANLPDKAQPDLYLHQRHPLHHCQKRRSASP
jgi:hypothetical protein